MEISDYILNRYLGSPYSPRKLYYLCLEETKPRTRKYADNISSAMDYGTNEDVQRAVLDFMKTQKYDSMLDRNKVENWILTEDWIREDVDSRNVKDDLDEDMKLWEERSKDEFGKVLKEIEKYCIDLWGLTNDYEVEGLEQSIISKYINTYALDGDRNYVARRIYRTLENFDMIDNNDDPRFMELVNEMLKLGGVNNISDSRRVKDDNSNSAISAFESIFNDDNLYKETLIDFGIDISTYGSVIIYSFVHPSPTFPITSGYTTGSNIVDDSLNNYYNNCYEDAIKEYGGDKEMANDDALYYVDEHIIIDYCVEFFQHDDGIIDILFNISDGIVTGRDFANDTIMSKTFSTNDIKGIKQFAQEIIDFIGGIKFD